MSWVSRRLGSTFLVVALSAGLSGCAQLLVDFSEGSEESHFVQGPDSSLADSASDGSTEHAIVDSTFPTDGGNDATVENQVDGAAR